MNRLVSVLILYLVCFILLCFVMSCEAMLRRMVPSYEEFQQPVLLSNSAYKYQRAANSRSVNDQFHSMTDMSTRAPELSSNCSGNTTDYTKNCSLTAILDNILKSYDKRIRPGFFSTKNRKPVMVGVTMFVSSVSSISEVDMDFTIDMYFRQEWRDERLAFENFIHPDAEDVKESVSVAEEMLQKFWWPDTFFANAKKAEFHVATTRNAFLRIDAKGNILHSLRLTVTAMCPMNLVFFPMDSQICTVEIESFGYTDRDINYQWIERHDGAGNKIPPVKVDRSVTLPQYIVKGTNEQTKTIVLSTGNYSRLSVEFFFQRSMGYYLIQIYIPSTLIVVLSWFSFWLSRAAVPARVALGITTVLTMTTLISSTNASLPKISYLKSIDVYLVTCFVMVFASLLEYAAVSYISKQVNSCQNEQCQRDSAKAQNSAWARETGAYSMSHQSNTMPPILHVQSTRPAGGYIRAKPAPPPEWSSDNRKEFYERAGQNYAARMQRETSFIPGNMDAATFDRTPNGTLSNSERQHLLSSSMNSSHSTPQHLLNTSANSATLLLPNNNGNNRSPFHTIDNKYRTKRGQPTGPQFQENRQNSANCNPTSRVFGRQYDDQYFKFSDAGFSPHRTPRQFYHANHRNNPGPSSHEYVILDYDSLDLEGLDNVYSQESEFRQHASACPRCGPFDLRLKHRFHVRPSSIDKWSRVFFPLTFSVFNVLYWVIYLYVSDETAKLQAEFRPLNP